MDEYLGNSKIEEGIICLDSTDFVEMVIKDDSIIKDNQVTQHIEEDLIEMMEGLIVQEKEDKVMLSNIESIRDITNKMKEESIEEVKTFVNLDSEGNTIQNLDNTIEDMDKSIIQEIIEEEINLNKETDSIAETESVEDMEVDAPIEGVSKNFNNILQYIEENKKNPKKN